MRRNRNRLWNLLLATSLLLGFAVPVTAWAADKSAGDSTGAVTQGYGTDSPLQNGLIVRQKTGDASKVVPLKNTEDDKVLGVIVAASDAPLTLSDDANQGQVFVASSGSYDVLVSNQNGPIKVGDYIAISALAGVGMKSTASQSVVVGRAKAAFSGSGQVVGTAQLKDTDGKTINISLGLIPVDISIAPNPMQTSSNNGPGGYLQRVSQSVAGKSVAPVRVYLAVIILIGAVVVTATVVYSGVRGGLVAIGRNPLGKKAIYSGIVRVLAAGLLIFIAGVFGVYLLLKL